ncbi:ribokinase [Superficieibacter electus]|uniref:Ribokinase n=1 Tax=Superficieibacter electus TaxID=2022662 RepID=A0A2P5GHU2_9ENTR|nr:ribokinase [Superficieibacter electus]POP40811.1 ribokinase [Superficieibacter electus]POP42255.1 ribokinase [Superficieibacter electus]
MFSKERQREILAYLNKHERATVNQLAVLFSVSKETIRNDLNILAGQEFIQRCHGGAIILRRIFRSKSVNDFGPSIVKFLNQVDRQGRSTSALKKKGQRMKNKVCILGSFNVDIIANVERFPKNGESLLASNTIIGPGGKGANQALAASKCQVQVHFVGKVGNDHFSKMAHDHLSSSDIDSFTLYQDEEHKTGSAIIYVSQSDGENMIAIYSGANQYITESEVANIASELADAKIFLTQLENNIEATHKALMMASSLGVKTILNPAPYSEHAATCLPYVDYLTPNETEASLMSGVEVNDIASAKDAARVIKSMGAKNIIITMGSQGVLIYDGKQFTHIPALKAVTVDTTGAGDAFNGAFAAAMAKEQSLHSAAKFACAFASLAVEREGAASMPDYQNVLSRLVQYERK